MYKDDFRVLHIRIKNSVRKCKKIYFYSKEKKHNVYKDSRIVLWFINIY